MNNTKKHLEEEIAKLSFAALETNLYLDGHTDDKAALRYFNKITREQNEKVKQYEKQYGPLTPSGNDSESEWQWSTQKWPWQMED